MSDNIKVVVKVRPLIPREIDEKLEYQWRIKSNTLYVLDHNGKETGQVFTFDKVYTEDTKTTDVYQDVVKPIVEAATVGINGTIFAYGQTSSGKTYTMTGTEQSPGIIPLAVQDLFHIIKNKPDRDFLVRVSYIEIYNETINDMLNVEKKNVKIYESFGGVKIDAVEKMLGTPEEVLKVMEEGQANRHVGSTNMNEESSRSHSIFQITIESREHVDDEAEMGCVIVSQLNLVDLAGSERSGQTGATGVRFVEGTHINKSLSTLALVIRQLGEEPRRFISYRGSKLTRILQNSLGGNARTCIVCAVTPAAVEETISTLQFANRAKAIKNKPEVNAVSTSNTMLENLTKQMCKLQSQLESKKNLEKDNVNLQKQLVALQQLIINGFNQRSTKNIDKIQKKQSQLRRATISALPSNEKDINNSPPTVKPKFCTPLLKYNPACLEVSHEASSNQASAKPSLPTVHEEILTAVTPPRKKTVNFDTEIIEIDSGDEENTSDVKLCSPVHECYDASKTPPCVLRKTVKQVEKSLKEHIELTELEKMYSPKVVELIQQLQVKTTMINEMKEEKKMLHKQIKDRDFEAEVLKHKINKTEEELKSIAIGKVDLEKQCFDMGTKLTELEVIYETLKKKSKLREDELLSLIADEKKQTPYNPNLLSQKTVVTNFMDLSKDISLVHSDNENSIIEQSSKSVSDIHTDHINELNETVVELESKINEQKLQNAELQKTIEKLLQEVTDVQEKNTVCENDKLCLQSIIESLKSKINSQETDISSYNNLIRELQIKLTKKDLTNINLNDSAIDSILETEEKLINNSEKLKIVCQLKQAVDTRDNEINVLKSRLDGLELNNDSEKHDLKKLLQDRDDQIAVLMASISMHEEQNNQYITLTEKLDQRIHDMEDQITKLKEQNINTVDEVEALRTLNSKMNLTIQDKTKSEESLSSNVEHLENKLQNKESELLSATTKINDLTEKIEQHLCAINQLNEKVNINNNQILSQLEVIKTINEKNELLEQNINDIKSSYEKAIELSNNKIDKLKQELLEKDSQIAAINDATQSEVNAKNINTDTYIKEREEWTTLERQLYEKLERCQNDIEASEEILEEKNSQMIELKSNIENYIVTIQERDDDIHTLNNKNEDLAFQNSELNSLVSELRKTIQDNTILITNLEENQSSETKSLITKLQNTVEKIIESLYEDTEPEINIERPEMLSDILQYTDSAISALILDKRNFKIQLMESTEMYKAEIKNLKNKIVDEEKKLFEINAQNADLIIENTRLSEELEKSLKCCAHLEEKLSASHNQYMDYLQHSSSNIIETPITEFYKTCTDCEDCLLKLLPKLLHLVSSTSNSTASIDTSITDLPTTSEKILILLQMLDENIMYSIKAQNVHDIILSKDNKDAYNTETVAHMQEQLKYQLQQKTIEIQELHSKTNELKSQLESLGEITQHQFNEMQLENMRLKVKCRNSLSISFANVEDKHRKDFPPSLLSICLKKMDNLLKSDQTEPNLNDRSLESHTEFQASCHCASILLEYEDLKKININLTNRIEGLNLQNKTLLNEQEEVKSEIFLLLETIKELQKKVFSHRTNLSTLTATTYAENQLLHSQVKALQHHHNRFYNVCLRDLPTFKKQLEELGTILKDDESYNYRHNTSLKRYSLPDVLDNSSFPNIHNESTLDGDLLMLDTNLTITTVDTTLLGLDQTHINHINISQTATGELNKMNSADNSNLQIQIATPRSVRNNSNLYTELSFVKSENQRLQDQIKLLSMQKDQTQDAYNALSQKVETLSQDLFAVMEQKKEIESKYQNLILEMPSSETLVKKINTLEQEIVSKNNEVNKHKTLLDSKIKQLNALQIEYEEISTQVIDNISEVDSLKEEIRILKETNNRLNEEYLNLENSLKEEIKILKESNNRLNEECLNLEKVFQCNGNRQATICSRQNATGSHIHLNRSLSDSDSSSSLNKICTLQKELCAGKEDCKQLTEEVTTIKNHLEHSNMSAMDLDESENPLNFTTSSTTKISQSLQPIQENITECLDFIIEKTGLTKSDIDCNVTLTDLMKLLHDKLVHEHGSKIQNLLNHVKILEDTQINLKDEICNRKKELQVANQRISEENNKINQIKNNIEIIKNSLQDLNCGDNTTLSAFKDNVLHKFDSEFNSNCSYVFNCIMQSIVMQNENILHEITTNNKNLQEQIENLVAEKNSVLSNLSQLNNEMDKREQDYNTLKTQKEMIHEISKAVTLDIIRKEKEFNQTLKSGCIKLIENNIICPNDVDVDALSYENLSILFENIIKQRNNEKENILIEIKQSKELLKSKEQEVVELRKDIDRYNADAKKISENVIEYAKQLESQNSLYENLKTVYESKSEENVGNIKLVERLTEEILVLKNTLSNYEEKLQSLEKEVNKDNVCNECNIKDTYILELAEKIKEAQELRFANDIINSEKVSLEEELEKANSIILAKSLEIDKMKSDIIVFKEAASENLSFINQLKEETKLASEINTKLKEELEEKCKDFSRLNINLKTHEKTAEIQSKMINRLTTQHDNVIQEKDRQIEELLSKQLVLQQKCEEASIDASTVKENIEKLLANKEELEHRIEQLERDRDQKLRLSIESNVKSRRQSLHDSKRQFGDQVVEDNNKLEELFKSRSKLDDMFMDVDDDTSSNRNSPIRVKKNDSNQSRLEEISQESSRPSSVQATRRRRQSIHDLHRSVVHSPHDQLDSPSLHVSNNLDPENRSDDTEAAQLRERIIKYLEEIEELKERNKELDEECDTCAEYLKERDEQCLRLKKEKSSLEKIIEELQEKLKSYNPQQSQLEESKRFMVNASVNTDEDWANLHSVVVDRMSYDAEVDKNKRFAKVIEELRFKKQELRTTIGKMQAVLDRNSRKESHELENLKGELDSLKQELNVVKQRNKELDEECETCAQYLRERDQQCRKLKEAKDSLEAKLEELQNDHTITQSLRKKRQSIHDQNRPSNVELHDACTQIGEDLVTYQIDREAMAKKSAEDAQELKRLKMTVDKLRHQKASLEHQVVTLTATVQPALYVATGSAIVQNQQITDVMKENQKLKKMNAKLVNICKKRGKLLTDSNRENEDPMEQSSNM